MLGILLTAIAGLFNLPSRALTFDILNDRIQIVAPALVVMITSE